jgi:hypothetical protein
MVRADPRGNRLYCFRRKHADGRTSLLAGAECWAPDPAEAMRWLKLTWGHTAKQGWYAEDVTDDQKFRAWAQR